ncbi:MAG TPA: undecaprenyl-diphosphate phosphatase [Tepidisphaeraceae bacterium]|nr:undecaprenyl-diphosphate phosphatase [Tepidisphaeraceae bacterium]
MFPLVAAAATTAATHPALSQPLHNNYLLSVLLGIIEGLTEFLPVSSTAHLRILEKLATDYHWADIDLSTGYWKMYTVVIQLGAILCLPIYFLPRILKFIRTFPRGERGDRNIFNHPLSLTMIAFVVTAGPAYLLAKKIGENLDNFYVIGSALLIGGIVMWIIDAIFGERPSKFEGFDAVTAAIVDHGRLAPQPADGQPPRLQSVKTRHMEQMTVFQAIWIGACQILSAVFPGTSRSMATIAAGQLAGLNRPTALEFSFFVSIPTMGAATLFALKKALKPGVGQAADVFSPKTMTHEQWVTLGIGFAVSFIVAMGVVAWFMSWVRRRGFAPFAIYRIILGAAVLWYAWRGVS